MSDNTILGWVLLYSNGSSTTEIAKQYGVNNSTISRNLRRYIELRNQLDASVTASTKYPKSPFSGNMVEAGFLAGLVEDFHVRGAGRLIELNSATTHPAMEHLFRQIFAPIAHPTLTPTFNPRGYYQYRLSTYLHRSFEPFLRKSENIPTWVPRSSNDSTFRAYLSGLIAAEGCIRLYCGNGRAHAVLHITLNKPALLEELSRIIGGHLYQVQRAWRLVIYGRAAVALLHNVDPLHEEKAEKSKLVIDHAGEKWVNVEPLWLRLVTCIKAIVKQYKAQAKLDYIEKQGIPHPSEDRMAKVALCQETQSAV